MIQPDLSVNERIDRCLELLVAWILSTSVLGLITALAGHFLALQVCLASLLVAGVYAWFTRERGTTSRVTADWRHLALLTLVCLFFRLPAYHYVLGGQDEGVYVNMAHHIARTGGIEVRDTAFEQLDDPSLTATYLRENRDAGYLPGVYALERSGPLLQFQFYHLFPVWMAIFEGLFGATFGVYALTFFSWLSTVFIYRLALAVSGSRMAALITGALLAVNPLHAFFSKFPVTEVPALAFSLAGFTFLAFFRDGRGQASGARWLWLSMASFGCLFVTRISGFMYMPFVLAAAMASAIADRDRYCRRAMFGWCAGVMVLYALSVWYGLRWSGSYSSDIYRLSFERLFSDRWPAGVSIAAAAGLAAWLGTAATTRSEPRQEQMSRYVLTPVRRVVGLVVVVSLLMGLFKIYQLGWTGRFMPDAWLSLRWHLAGSRWVAVEASSLFQLLVYTGPVLLAGVVALTHRQSDPRVEFLRLFAAGFLVYACLLQWTVPYGPYYARYLLSENVPYLLLFTVLVWAGMRAGWQKTATTWLLGVSMFYMAVASAGQLGKNENAGLYGSLKRMLAPVGTSDLVLMITSQPGPPAISQIKTPVLYTFGREVINVSNSSLTDSAYIAALDARFDDVYLLSASPSSPRGFDLVNSERLKVWGFASSFLFPHEFTLAAERRLYLYRLKRSMLPLSQAQSFNTKGAWNAWLASGWSSPETWGTWSLGKHAELSLDPRQLPATAGGIRLHFEANALVSPQHSRQRIDITLNGRSVAQREVALPQSALAFDVVLPESVLREAGKLIIGFDLPDAVSPQAIGMGGDGRMLALGLKSVTAYPSVSPASSQSSPSTILNGK
ncbi:phospholipid carrier-dependent glycosyltransferase [Frateuria sp. MAH-13]|uniref:Phospholipid carrier-dependent glycosyltransferase n=1 Tax=Frateuria flava TaxID=2821489 RepID=A0ABS4DQY2_9GAMM|nr:phospholipid carrier-dependent glycosyltransferase [Frateuria flava]MBP1475466.1 phospholipid carrier-dependent glycosyltransferase [Frateuria flava]